MKENELANNLTNMEWEVYEVPPLTLRRVFTPQQVEILLPLVRSYAALERAGMREACANFVDSRLRPLMSTGGIHMLVGSGDLRREICSLPDLAADEAIERVKAAAQEPWRRFLWLNHSRYLPHQHMPYGDDGEMQCCGIDFKRDSAEAIERYLDMRIAALTAAAKESK